MTDYRKATKKEISILQNDWPQQSHRISVLKN